MPTAGDVSADYSQSGQGTPSFQATYVNGLGIDQKATRIASGGTRTHFMGDQVGSVTSLLDNEGKASDHMARDLFGNLKAGSSSASRYGFQQREVDSESGWMNFRNRMYDPRTGRFGGVDRVLNNRATEQYLCVANNPLSFIDPMGDRWKIKKGSGNAGMLRDLEIYTGRKITVDAQGYVWFGGSNGGKPYASGKDRAWIQGVQDDSSETDVEQLWVHIVNGDEWHREQFKAAWLANSGLETAWQAFNKGADAGAQGFVEGVTLGAIPADEWAREMDGFKVARGIGTATLAIELALAGGVVAVGDAAVGLATASNAAQITMAVGGLPLGLAEAGGVVALHGALTYDNEGPPDPIATGEAVANVLLNGMAQHTPSFGSTAGGRPVNRRGQVLGPSGKPMRHSKHFNTRKAAQDAARADSHGAPDEDAAHRKGGPHFHATDKEGKRKKKDNVHYEYDD